MSDTPTRRHLDTLQSAVSVILSLALMSCVSKRHDTGDSRTVGDTAQAKSTVSEIQSDNHLARALGVAMRTIEVRYPSSMKLSVTTRVYRKGVLDRTMSSRQVHGTTMQVGNQYLSLGWYDSDVTSPERQGKLKIFGSPGTIWIEKPSAGNFGGFIDVPKRGEIAIQAQQLVMELAYGSGTPRSSLGLGAADIREGAIVRITIHVLIEPLTTEEREQLKTQSNFNKAFRVDD